MRMKFKNSCAQIVLTTGIKREKKIVENMRRTECWLCFFPFDSILIRIILNSIFMMLKYSRKRSIHYLIHDIHTTSLINFYYSLRLVLAAKLSYQWCDGVPKAITRLKCIRNCKVWIKYSMQKRRQLNFNKMPIFHFHLI